MAIQDFHLRFQSVARTHQGAVRTCNEDVYLERTDIGLWAVADGMGGHQKGDIAAAQVVGALSAIQRPDGQRAYLAAVQDSLKEVNRQLYERGAGISDDQTMGATIAAMFAFDRRFTCIWAGDSRLYRLRNGTCEPLTKDHSLVQEMVDAGALREDEIETHPKRNIITRAIGAERDIELDTIEGEIEPGDIFILVTDGVTTLCSAREIADTLNDGDITSAADRLVDLCLERGAPDNLSLVIVEWLKRTPDDEPVQRRLAAILAADVVGFSRLMEIDEETALRTLKGHRAIIDALIARHEGRIFSTAGDSVVAEFRSAVEAVRTAMAIQQALKARNAQIPADTRMTLRIGVNLGDIMVEGDNLFGDGVNVAARIEGLCVPGDVYVSGSIHNQVEGKTTLSFEDMGEQSVKNISKPVRVYRVLPEVKEEAARDLDEVAPALPDKPSSAAPDRPSIVVLPFENMGGDAEQEVFADGITEDIITSLSRNSLFSVVSRHSSLAYKGKAVSVKQVGRDLQVRYVLEGSVRRAGNRLRITVQLIDAELDHHVWVERYDRDADDIYAVQDEVAQNVAEALEVVLSPSE